jgi:[ribosomal protein S18]-alanine N-acetyltransferase
MKIEQTTSRSELEKCARLMSGSEPWLTLKRDFAGCLNAVKGDHKEVYILTDQGTLIGFAVLQMTGTFKGYIQSICIRPESRNKGIGSALLQFCEKRIFKDSPNVFICVSSFNHAAEKLYYKLGYSRVGELEDFIVKGHSEILLRKTIGTVSDFAVRTTAGSGHSI